MNRPLKFRAWDKEGKKMYELGYLADIAYTTEFEHNWGNDLRRYEIMQYTGLKDKNGVEIYEGDVIVKGHLPKDTKFTVEFDDGTFNALGESDSEILGFSNSWEVIGNIYETPELLKADA